MVIFVEGLKNIQKRAKNYLSAKSSIYMNALIAYSLFFDYKRAFSKHEIETLVCKYRSPSLLVLAARRSNTPVKNLDAMMLSHREALYTRSKPYEGEARSI